MRCPECDTLYGDELRGRFHCTECNTNLVVRADKHDRNKLTLSVETPRASAERAPVKPTLKRVWKTPTDKVLTDKDLQEHCYFCGVAVSHMTKVIGNTLVTFNKGEKASGIPGVIQSYLAPVFKKVSSCQSCMSQLDSVLPFDGVNPVEDRYSKGRGPIVKTVREVTGDREGKWIGSSRSDIEPAESSFCADYVPFHGDVGGKCLFCGKLEVAHRHGFDPGPNGACKACGRPSTAHETRITRVKRLEKVG